MCYWNEHGEWPAKKKKNHDLANYICSWSDCPQKCFGDIPMWALGFREGSGKKKKRNKKHTPICLPMAGPIRPMAGPIRPFAYQWLVWYEPCRLRISWPARSKFLCHLDVFKVLFIALHSLQLLICHLIIYLSRGWPYWIWRPILKPCSHSWIRCSSKAGAKAYLSSMATHAYGH